EVERVDQARDDTRHEDIRARGPRDRVALDGDGVVVAPPNDANRARKRPHHVARAYVLVSVQSPAPAHDPATVIAPFAFTLIEASRYAIPEKNVVVVSVDGTSLSPTATSPIAIAKRSVGVVNGSQIPAIVPLASLKPWTYCFVVSLKQVTSARSREKSAVHALSEATVTYVVAPVGSIRTSPLYPCCRAIPVLP